MKNAREFLIHIRTNKKVEQVKLTYGQVVFTIRDNIVSGTVRLSVRATSEHEPLDIVKNFPIQSELDDIAKHIVKVVNNTGDAKFPVKRADVLRDLDNI